LFSILLLTEVDTADADLSLAQFASLRKAGYTNGNVKDATSTTILSE
jgi:hypothetical protein